MPKALATWESLWPVLLREAVQQAKSAGTDKHPPLGKSAVSIIVARSTWDAYIAEFVEWRQLSPKIKYLGLYKSLEQLHRALDLSELGPPNDSFWDDLILLNKLRNEIVHHKAALFPLGSDGPTDILGGLAARDLLATSEKPALTWERRVLTAKVGHWSCRTVARGILKLERIPEKRSRSYHDICNRLVETLSPLGINRPEIEE